MTTRKTWTREEILACAKMIALRLGHFPSNSDLERLGRSDLSNQICRNGGFVAISKEVGIARRKSDSDTGWDGEIAVAEILRGKGFSVERMDRVRHPFDLLVDGCVRIDVKSASFASYGEKGVSQGHFFRIGKVPTCDIVILYRSDLPDCFIIPWNVLPRTNVTITPTGDTYTKYLEAWPILHAASEAFLRLNLKYDAHLNAVNPAA